MKKVLFFLIILIFVGLVLFNNHRSERNSEALKPVCDGLTNKVVEKLDLGFPDKFGWAEKYEKRGLSGKVLGVAHSERVKDYSTFRLCIYTWLNIDGSQAGGLHLGLELIDNSKRQFCQEPNLCFSRNGLTYRALFASSFGEDQYGRKSWEAPLN